MDDIVIGIDLGTTNTGAAYYFNGQVRILENEEGGRITPSYVFIMEKDKFVVGQYARHMANAKPEYGIYEIKRLVGRKFNDPYVQNNLQYFPFQVVSESNEPVIVVERNNYKIKRTPEELCTTILAKIKTDAEAKIGKPIDKAVITVPAYFNVSQRQVTLLAANKAGFTVLKLMNEPTAAALCYYFETNCKDQNHFLVYDLGGGTFDVAILKKHDNNIDIIGVDGDTHLGGHDFDNLIIDYVCGCLQMSYKYNPKTDRRAMRRIRNECEEAKKTLSMCEETTIVLDGFVKVQSTGEIDFTRQQFEQMADKLFQRTIAIIDNCLKSCNVTKSDIKEVILSGGSTRIPKIQKLISSYFGGKTLNKFVNPDECVAKGAALQAAMFSSNLEQKLDVLKITDVVSLSLGISHLADLMTIYIKRNTKIPVSQTFSTANVSNKQTTMRYEIYEGERMDARKNHLLCTFNIADVTPSPPGQCEVSVTMSVDVNGILSITAKENLRQNEKKLTIAYTRGHRSNEEVKNTLKDAEDNKTEDQRFVKFASMKAYLLKYCECVKYNFEKKKLRNLSYKHLFEMCKTTKDSARRMNLEDEDKLAELVSQLTMKCQNVVKEYDFELMPVRPTDF